MNSPSQHHEDILRMRLEGKRASDIADALDMNISTVRNYIYRNRVLSARGVNGLCSALTPEQQAKLSQLSDKWECTTAEAAVEILRDWLDETAAQEGAP